MLVRLLRSSPGMASSCSQDGALLPGRGLKRVRQPARFRSLGAAKTPSPTSLGEVMQWPRYVLDRMGHAGLGARLRDVCSSGIYLSTHYSGMGGAELALRMLMDEMRAFGCQAWMHSWHAGDLSAFCRSVLLRHPGAGHDPQHVFRLRAEQPWMNFSCRPPHPRTRRHSSIR